MKASKFVPVRTDNIGYLVDCGILDYCLRNRCAFPNSTCRCCPFSQSYRMRFRISDVIAQTRKRIVKHISLTL